MLIKSQALAYRILNPTYSILKSLDCGPKIKRVNPFRHKTYAELNRMLDSTMAQDEYINMHSLILNALSSRIQDQSTNKKAIESVSRQSKLALLNKCLFRLMEKQQQLTPSEIIIIIQSILAFQASKEMNLSREVFSHAKIQLAGIIQEMARNDQEGKYQQEFHRILYLSLEMGGQSKKVRELVGYFYRHGLKTNQQIITFLTFLLKNSQISDYGLSLQKIFTRYINNNAENLNNAQQWLHPIIIDIYINSKLYTRRQNNKLLRQYISAIKHAFYNNKLNLENKLVFLQRIVNFGAIDDLSFLTLKQQKQDAIFAYDFFKATLDDLRKQTPLNESQNCMFSMNNFKKYFHKISFAINLSGPEIDNELRQFMQQVFLKRIVTDDGSINHDTMINFMKKDIEMSDELQIRVVELIVQKLEHENNLRNLISKIRLYEYAAFKIAEGKLGLSPQMMKKCLSRLQNNIHRFNKFTIIRVYNIMRVLKFNSKAFEDFYHHFCKQNQVEVIQNFSRTILRKYSTDIILKLCGQMIHKTNKIENKQNIDAMKAIWHSLRNFEVFEEQAKNQVFEFWLNQNQSFFNELSALYKNVMFLTKLMSSEMKNHLFFSSVRLQLLIETLRAYMIKSQNKNDEKHYRQFIQISMRFLVHPQIVNFSQKDYRHSLFIKCLWSYSYLLNSYKKNKEHSRSHMVLYQIRNMIGLDERRSLKQKRALKKILLTGVIDHIQHQELNKMGFQTQILDFWLWAHTNHCEDLKVFTQIKFNHPIRDKVLKFITNNYGHLYRIQFLLSINPNAINQQLITEAVSHNLYPADLVQFQFNQNTVIDDNALIDCLSYPRTMQYFLKEHTESTNAFFRKLSEVKINLNPSKLIEADNLFMVLQRNINGDTKQKFYGWVDGMLEKLWKMENYGFSLICLKIFRIPEFGQQRVRMYIRKQFENGNLYLNSLVYANGIKGINQEVRQIMQYCQNNRIFTFLQQQPIAFLSEINNLLGMVLLQNDHQLLQDFFTLFQHNLSSLQSHLSSERDVGGQNELYLLLKVAHSRLLSTENDIKDINDLIGKLEKRVKDLKSQVLKWINDKNGERTKQIGLEVFQTPYQQLQLAKVNEKFVYVRDEEKGCGQMVVEYLQTLKGLENSLCLHRQSLLQKI